MGQKVSKTKVPTKDGCMYYLGSDGHVWEYNRKTKRKTKVGSEKITREPGYLYYVANGYVSRAAQARGGKKKKMGAKIVAKGDFKTTTEYKQGKLPKYQPLKKVATKKIGTGGKAF
jgi:hypothetical protein